MHDDFSITVYSSINPCLTKTGSSLLLAQHILFYTVETKIDQRETEIESFRLRTKNCITLNLLHIYLQLYVSRKFVKVHSIVITKFA